MENEEVYNNFRSIAETKFPEEVAHLQDLWKTPAKTLQNVLVDNEYKIEPNVSHMDNLYLCVHIALNALLTLFTDFTLALKHPIYWLYVTFVYPIIIVAYFLLEVSLFALTTLKLDGIKNKIDDKWSEYTTPIELFDSEFFSKDENNDIIDEGVGALDKPYYNEYEDDDDSAENAHNCNLDIAQLLLFMSDLVYNRDASKVLKAKQKLNMIKFQPDECENILQEVVTLLVESDEKIIAQSKKWRLKYITVSELNSLGDSFAGIYYSERHNFIVVTFKGTTVDNFEKWMTEMMFQRIDGQTFFNGKSYNGYRSILYTDNSQSGPYATIIEGIRNAVNQIRSYRERNSSKKRNINIWVTGHSLGGAMATMFYARCINSPSDLGEHCVLRDAYTFGSPCVGNSEFAKTYMSALDKRDEVSNTLWRIVNDNDIVCKLPIGFYHPGSVGKYNLLDNTHIGEAIRFYQGGNKPTLIKNPLIPNRDKDHYPIIKSSRPNEPMEIKIPVSELDKNLPALIRNNTISRYAISMALARTHLRKKNYGNTARTKSGYHGEIGLDDE